MDDISTLEWKRSEYMYAWLASIKIYIQNINAIWRGWNYGPTKEFQSSMCKKNNQLSFPEFLSVYRKSFSKSQGKLPDYSEDHQQIFNEEGIFQKNALPQITLMKNDIKCVLPKNTSFVFIISNSKMEFQQPHDDTFSPAARIKFTELRYHACRQVQRDRCEKKR